MLLPDHAWERRVVGNRRPDQQSHYTETAEQSSTDAGEDAFHQLTRFTFSYFYTLLFFFLF